MSYTYLASPYSSDNPSVVAGRFLETEIALAWLLKNKIWAYSPIVHCHALARAHSLPLDAKYWEDYNKAMLAPARSLTLFLLPGWHKSKGCTVEREFAESLSKPLILLIYDNATYHYHRSSYSAVAKMSAALFQGEFDVQS